MEVTESGVHMELVQYRVDLGQGQDQDYVTIQSPKMVVCHVTDLA